MVHKLGGDNCPKLHLVAFRAAENVQKALRDLAGESHGYYHRYSSDQQPPSDNQKCGTNIGPEVSTGVDPVADLVENSDVNSVKEEIAKAQRILIDIGNLKHGPLDHSLLEQLREVLYTV